MKHFWDRLLLLIACLLIAIQVNAKGVASQLFSELRKQVYQIRVIDTASGDKSSIGSGFQISADGFIATNFHVVADFVHKPDKHELQYVYHDGSTGDLELMAIDVIHDLAIVKMEPQTTDFFRFSGTQLSQGDRIYSMGNPHDLGMTIIEGNYNGLIKASRYKKILFSGSLNAGMSGGPAIDDQGYVIGVNVAKGGEQLSFLVPVGELNSLLEQVLEKGKSADFEADIGTSLIQDQDNFYKTLLAEDWSSEPFLELTLPGQISSSLKCWGHTLDSEENRYEGVHQHCRSEDEIYLHERFFTGSLFYDYEWMASDDLNRFQFYNLLQERFTHKNHNNVVKKEDVSNFQCLTDFVELNAHAWRISSCLREYKKYPGLYDALLLLASVDENHKGAIIKTGATGISQENTRQLMHKFMESIQWIP